MYQTAALNFFKPHLLPNHCPPEQKLNGRRHSTKRLGAAHSIYISKIAMHLTASLKFVKQHLPNHIFSSAETWWKASGEMSAWKCLNLFIHIIDGNFLKGHLEILQTSSSNPYVLISQKLIGDIRQYGDSE